MPEDKHPWRKQVQERIEEYLIAMLEPAETPFQDAHALSDSIAKMERLVRVRKAQHELPEQYRTVVDVLDFKIPRFTAQYDHLFLEWPKGRRRGLQQMLSISSRTLDDWHAKALDQMAESMGLKEASAVHSKPRDPLAQVRREEGRSNRQVANGLGWRAKVEGELILLGHTLLMDPMRAPTYEAFSEHFSAKHWTGAERNVVSQSERRDARQDAQADVHELVRDVLTNPQLHKLIRDRYWDRDVNHEHHPDISVEAYAQRLGVGRRRYYQLWDKALRLLAACLEIPMNNPE